MAAANHQAMHGAVIDALQLATRFNTLTGLANLSKESFVGTDLPDFDQWTLQDLDRIHLVDGRQEDRIAGIGEGGGEAGNANIAVGVLTIGFDDLVIGSGSGGGRWCGDPDRNRRSSSGER